MCEKQCRDENGMKCHMRSEGTDLNKLLLLLLLLLLLYLFQTN